jgi:hypothetical protein
MTAKDLDKLLSQYQQEDHEPKALQELKRRLYNRPFYIWGADHKKVLASRPGIYCCFNHIVGLPKKDGKEFPLFDYERSLYYALTIPSFLNSNPGVHKKGGSLEDKRDAERRMKEDYLYDFKLKHLWVKKATGLGVTEFMLRFMAWLCLRNDDCKGAQMVIVTGPNQELAIKLIKRMKGLFEPHGITFDTKETVLELNGCNIEAYPSHRIDAFRSLTNPKFILVDEGDFLPKFQQEDVRHVSERYIAKSDPFIVMVSTPNAPG